MTAASIIRELEQLSLTDRLYVLEQTLKSIRTDKQERLKQAVEQLHDDYKSDPELTVFTRIDTEDFYEAR